jgi:hypothetical protein
MMPSVDLPGLGTIIPQVNMRPDRAVAGASAGTGTQTGERRLADGERHPRERRADLRILPQPDPDPPTGPPPAFDVTPLEQMQDRALAVAIIARDALAAYGQAGRATAVDKTADASGAAQPGQVRDGTRLTPL